jgi:YegS/Rv2252/BmrU family lipid kinase
MHVTLIYNPQAGRTVQLGPEQILEALRQIGFDPVYRPTSTETDLDRVLEEARDLVVVAGGDGSIRAVAICLLGKNISIAPLPMGTANNIARMLALTASPLEIIAGLADPAERAVDIGRVQTPQGPFYFLEAMGIGVFADGMKKYKPEDGKSILRSIQSARDTLREYQPKFFHINLDGEDFSGSYLMLEVMNTPTMGLHYRLAPDAKADDGLFDLVLIHASQRENYLRFAAGLLTGTLEKLPEVSIHRGSRLEIAWRGFPLHLDGEVITGLEWIDEDKPPEVDESNSLDVAGPYLNVELVPKAIRFLVPGSAGQQGMEHEL